MKKEGFVSMPNKLCRSRVSPRAKALFAFICSYNPSYPPYSDVQKKMGMTDKTIAKTIAELLGRRMLEYKQGRFHAREANVYRVLPEKGWLLNLSEEESLSIGKRMMATQREAGLAFRKEAISLPNGKYKQNKKETNSLSEESKVVGGPAKQQDTHSRSIPSGSGCGETCTAPTEATTSASTNPATQNKTRTFLRRVRETLNGKEYRKNSAEHG